MQKDNSGGSPYLCHELSNIRVRRQFLSYLYTNDYDLNINITHDPVVFMREVMDYADDKTHRKYNDKELIGWVINKAKQCKEELLPDIEFNWLKNNDRACYYAWLSLRENQAKQPQDLNYYQRLRLPTVTSSSQERYDTVLSFFDCLPKSVAIKKGLLEDLKRAWGAGLDETPFKWLNKKDAEVIGWAYSYIETFIQDIILTRPPEGYLLVLENKPADINERYQAIYAMFDILTPVDKKILKDKINKTFSQRKFREKKKDETPLNTHMSKETKRKLDELREHYNKNIQQMIKQAIDQAYEKLHHDKEKERNE